MRSIPLAPLAVVCLLAALGGAPRAHGAAAAPFTIEDLVRLKRVSDPQLSPDARRLLYVQRETDMDANKGRTSLWLLDLERPGATPQRLTDGKGNDSSPRWAPDGQTLYFLSERSGSSQVWRLSLTAGEARRVSDYPLDVGTLQVSPRGDLLAVSMEVFPDCADLACSRARLDARAKDKASGRLYERMFVRHWDTWSDGTRSHLFCARLAADGAAGPPVDLSRSLDADVPGKPFGDDADYAFSPDEKSVALSARIAGHSEPWSTNFDLFQVPVDGSAAPVDLTANNPAWDAQPVFLPNGDLAWLAQDRPGFESDRFHIVLKSAATGAVRALTASWDRSVGHMAAARDGKHLIVKVEELGQAVLYSIEVASGKPARLTGSGEVTDFSVERDRIVYGLAGIGGPVDLYTVSLKGGTPHRLTDVNHELLAARAMSEFEQFSFKGWNNETVYGYVTKPYGFEPGKRFPVAFVVHGGPQGSFANTWSYRWNWQAFAGHGYAVVSIDFHGSTGYGQAFTDSISGDWGGKPLVDLHKGLAAAIERYPWLDGEHVCALGASYGGFMMNWIEGNWPDRFRCIVSHDGVFDQRMMYYATEELWFPEWEMRGTYYDAPQLYEKFNPVNFVSHWHTPMLVIHGEQDFRIPVSQGLGVFTALQRRGIESRLLVFPNENHWVLKPADSVQWYHTVLDWLDAHLKN
ncbi:MAG TPA: S9 family peptidase [Steroidobacteraceae bacterium]|jgi:dipeptidyl aminopeptidase/acylaminoacyl peptidase|nr:S9 family peptidase [Steroidobacteraceae bacterium]